MASVADIQAIISAAMDAQAKHLQEQLNSRDEVISKLMSKVGLDDDSSAVTTSGTPIRSKARPDGTSSQSKKGKASTAAGLGVSTSTPTRPNGPSPRRSASGQQTPKTKQQKTPTSQKKQSTGTPKTTSPVVNPLQMITAKMPAGFCSTRDALYVHIKIIWNLLEQKSIPGPPHPNTLTEFNSRFSDAEEIAQIVENVQGAPLVPVKEIISLKALHLGQRKIGLGIVNLDNFFVENTQATLARLGLRLWGPDLDDSPTYLFNEACRQAALKSFWQAAAGGAYTYMNINSKYAKDLKLLIPAYNHYVHFLQKNRYKREKKEIGKFRADEERKVIAQARDQVSYVLDLFQFVCLLTHWTGELQDTQLKFALAQRLPKKYQRMISDVNAHSDDEYNPSKGCYYIKKLKFQLENATQFFHRLDAAMLVSDQLEKKQPPKGLPLDFYDPDWFKNLLPQQRIDVADTHQVSLLPNATHLLQGKQVPSEKLTKKQFNAKFFDQLSAPYDLTQKSRTTMTTKKRMMRMIQAMWARRLTWITLWGVGVEDKYEESDQEDKEFVEEVMYSGNYDEYDKEEEDARDQRYNDMVLDEDQVW
ncbi:hypothetical protein VP01_3704g1 [Puccinia sorghi]|uniref:Uncharacterized protein n=1 Tax=Puccinia sorghi TaxID=27349 RepID=A0A0L6UUY2_9BASI|nr:hypothetical protein VP01_3704g1 [Puccinia sorghi]